MLVRPTPRPCGLRQAVGREAVLGEARLGLQLAQLAVFLVAAPLPPLLLGPRLALGRGVAVLGSIVAGRLGRALALAGRLLGRALGSSLRPVANTAACRGLLRLAVGGAPLLPLARLALAPRALALRPVAGLRLLRAGALGGRLGAASRSRPGTRRRPARLLASLLLPRALLSLAVLAFLPPALTRRLARRARALLPLALALAALALAALAPRLAALASLLSRRRALVPAVLRALRRTFALGQQLRSSARSGGGGGSGNNDGGGCTSALGRGRRTSRALHTSRSLSFHLRLSQDRALRCGRHSRSMYGRMRLSDTYLGAGAGASDGARAGGVSVAATRRPRHDIHRGVQSSAAATAGRAATGTRTL